MKVRYYGFIHPASSVLFEKIAALIELALGFEIVTPKTVIQPPEPMSGYSDNGSTLGCHPGSRSSILLDRSNVYIEILVCYNVSIQIEKGYLIEKTRRL